METRLLGAMNRRLAIGAALVGGGTLVGVRGAARASRSGRGSSPSAA